MTTTALSNVAPASVDAKTYFTAEQVKLIKDQIAPKVTDGELALFLYQCARTGLDPFSRQIYAIVRKQWNPETRTKEPKMTIQTGIDGFRVIAERTGRYAPGPEPAFEYDAGGRVRKATAFVKKQTADGTWHVVSASAHYDEYVAEYEGKPSGLWNKPHIMLGKCAEAQALRKAFPAELSGVYTTEEMAQAGSGVEPKVVDAEVIDEPQGGRQPPKASAGPNGSSAGTEATRGTSTLATTTTDPGATDGAATDTGEAPDQGELDALILLIRNAGWKKPHTTNFLKKHFGVTGLGGLTRAQVASASALLAAWKEDYDSGDERAYPAKMGELVAAGLVRAAEAA